MLVAMACGARAGEKPVAKAPAAPVIGGEPVLSTPSAILIDADSGLVLWERNPDVRMYPASLTKMMTGLLAVQYGQMQQTFRASKAAATTGESSINLALDEPLTLRQLLQAALIKSANDATVMVAESVAGSLPDFVQMMNNEAARLGLTGTHFTNPHGLHDPAHYSTARDMATLARAGMANATFAEIVGTREAVIPWTGKPWARQLINRNRLMFRWQACDGVKTGYTKHAGRCLAASATVDRWRLICIVLHCKDSWADARALLDWGYANYTRQRVARVGEVYRVAVRRGARRFVEARPRSDLYTVVRQGQYVASAAQEQGTCQAPVSVGQVVGHLTTEQGASVELLAVEPMPLSLWARMAERKVPQVGAGAIVLLAAGVLLHGASTKAARARRRRLQARQRRLDPPGSSDDQRATGTTGK